MQRTNILESDMIFNIDLGDGPSPLRFGMTIDETSRIIGPGRRFQRDKVVTVECLYPDILLGFDRAPGPGISTAGSQDVLVWVTFPYREDGRVLFEGKDVFLEMAESLVRMLSRNGSVRSDGDDLVFDDIGIAYRAISCDSDRVLALFAPGTWEKYA